MSNSLAGTSTASGNVPRETRAQRERFAGASPAECHAVNRLGSKSLELRIECWQVPRRNEDGIWFVTFAGGGSWCADVFGEDVEVEWSRFGFVSTLEIWIA